MIIATSFPVNHSSLNEHQKNGSIFLQNVQTVRNGPIFLAESKTKDSFFDVRVDRALCMYCSLTVKN
jgi:hypothetical protein